MSGQPVQPLRVSALPISSQAHTSKAARHLNETNQKLTMQLTQARADSQFDPAPNPRPTTEKVIQNFVGTSTPLSVTLLTVAALCVVYSIVAK
jgi:hypothetical protein